MKYKIKNRGITVVMLSLIIVMACLGSAMTGANMPEKYPSTEGAVLGVGLFFLSIIAVIFVLNTMGWEEIKLTDMDKSLEEEINNRVNIKLRKIVDELNKTT